MNDISRRVLEVELDFGKRAWAEIDLDALVWNYRAFREKCQAEVIAVVKANAYGHGAVPIVKQLEREGCNRFCVACVDEALALREAGVQGEIFCLAPSGFEDAVRGVRNGVGLCIASEQDVDTAAHAASACGLPATVHLKVDTGMGRLGIHPRSLEKLLSLISECPELRLRSVFSHMSTAEDLEDDFSQVQLDRFAAVVETARKIAGEDILFHIANSAGALRYAGNLFGAVRVGLGLYGINPFGGEKCDLPLRPVMRLRARVIQVKAVPDDTPIGYGRSHITRGRRRIATLSIGYADGFPRRLSNRGRALVHGQTAPIVGRVCMDLCMADVTDIDDVRPGEIATLIGQDGNRSISVLEIASTIDTVPHEVLACISARVERFYLSGGMVLSQAKAAAT